MPGVRLKEGLSRLPFWAAIFVVLICVSILGLSAWREWGSRETDLTNAEVDMANLARSLSRQADDSMELLDATIVGVVTRLEMDGTGPQTISQLQKVLDNLKDAVPRVSSLSIYDESGRWPATAEEPNRMSPDVSDRDYFQHHEHSTSHDAFVGPPIKSRTIDQWAMTVTRRFNHRDGSFAGVVLASVRSDYFAEFYRQFEIGSNGSVSLLSAGGTLLARSYGNDAFVGVDLSQSALFQAPLLQSRTGAYDFKSPFDGSQRLSFFKRSERFPLVVLATMDREQVLAPWRKAATTRTIFVALLTLLIAVIGGALVRDLHLRQRLVSALVAKEADFRLLAEGSSDMVTRIGLDERLRYVSPSSAAVVGWDAGELTGTRALVGVHADDLPAVAATVAALKQGNIADTRLVYRMRHRDAREIWLESTMRVTRDPASGEIDGVVAISRDITAQKIAQDELAALATIDGLTGLANRRRFDEGLQAEWARACREGSSLSLLMMDVDHFKKYNDQYGHPAGDACLKAIATVLTASIRRPADLAARYGGEEFVLLLPNTDAAGCALVGERIKLELRKLNIPHALNRPSGRATASLGGATMLPAGTPWTECGELLTAADGALYAAKDRGRDGLVMWNDTTPKRDIGYSRGAIG
jgi:diguanylate cyclase (GGDEF)-like protein/PAS domain S-box-containing protein